MCIPSNKVKIVLLPHVLYSVRQLSCKVRATSAAYTGEFFRLLNRKGEEPAKLHVHTGNCATSKKQSALSDPPFVGFAAVSVECLWNKGDRSETKALCTE